MYMKINKRNVIQNSRNHYKKISGVVQNVEWVERYITIQNIDVLILRKKAYDFLPIIGI